MCGIAGVRKYGKTPITEEELNILLCTLEKRGNHATGIALLTDGKVHIHKAPVPAWAFVAAKETRDFYENHLTPDTTMAILHTRFSTIGNPEVNENNHPIFSGHTAIVHNGGISNQLHLFSSEKLNRSCETDSDVIRALLDRDGLTNQGLTALNKMTGSAAIAAISEDFPDTLLLARSGSPLTYATTEDKLWWASELVAIQRAVRPWTTHHGLFARRQNPDVSYFTMPDHTGYILSADGPPIRREFKSCLHYVQPDYSRLLGDNYGTRTRSYKRAMREQRRALPQVTTIVEASTYTDPKINRVKIGPCPGCFKLNSIPALIVFKGKRCYACDHLLDALDSMPGNVKIVNAPQAS